MARLFRREGASEFKKPNAKYRPFEKREGPGTRKFKNEGHVQRMAHPPGAADMIEARAILVHAIDEEAAQFYGKYGFELSPLEPRQMMLLMKDLRATLSSHKGK